MSEEITGYDALNFDGLERRGNYRFIAYREDMLHALDKKDAAATIYQIVYRWQVEYKRAEVLKKIDERKKSGQKPYTQEEVEDMMFVYMSYNDFVHESGGAIGYNTVIRTLDYLVDKKKALKQRPNHDPKYPDFEYSVNKEVVRELLNALPPDPAFAPKIPKKKNDSTQMGTPENPGNRYTQMGTGSTQTGIPYTQMGTEVYPNGGTSQELTSNTQELTGKTSMSSSDDAPSHQSEKDVYEKRIAELENKIAYFLQASKDGNYPPVPPKGDARPTSAGGNASSQDSASRIHPEHSFIRLDDLDQPTVMIVTLTHAFPHPHSSEMEDKRRERIAAWEVLPAYKKKGLEVEVRWEHETERQTVDVATTIVESTAVVGGDIQSETPTHHNVILEPPCNATMPLTQDSAIIPQSENTPSESLPQTQEMPSSTQAVDESNRQATEQGASNVSSSLIPVDTYPRNIGGLLHHSEIGGQQNQESISLLPDVGASNRASMVCDIPNTQLKQASGDDPIAGVTTNIFTELPFKDRPVEVKRNGRKVNPVNERVKWFYDVFTALGAEFFEDDTFKADYVYSKNDPMYKLIITYVSEGVSPYEMRMAFEHMWNEERDGQYFWQNPDTLTNRAFCKHLRSKISSAKFKIKQAERRASSNGSKNTPRASTAGSQYIVDELEEAALASIAAMEG